MPADTPSIGDALLAELARTRLMPIIRGDSPDQTLRCVEVILDGGLTVLEISLTGAGALKALERACAEFGSAAWIGAGTVLTAADASAAGAVGARFTVTPGICDGLTKSVDLGLPVLAGAWTPTEVLSATAAQACAVKLFPASTGGPSHLRALRAPLPNTSFVPVGGIALTAAREYLEAGAIGIGIAAPLLRDAPSGGDLAALAARVAEYRRTVEAL
ncbi:bifunctional 4-hydroxy-2-oxoglutarate aldolase/2-dehydro-3-deoxy-phosphogluconate aldolase [Kribbella sp. NPDC004875]|uniref:bifunctional 4-hydroxy-2-oxoglutarate aldolase/2-dehydro-3-deoxy-phosphogluconate aldolase n=1 Tax=Kribbella sp. NPDC004875 TaxID=3364107 RepID=UPI0036CFC632